ncbi:hypothetical protein DVH05_005806 [Phytophthora capsici]|nr:hypothetical protein DVH05_005806 [Phytophthora capsici]
MSNSNEAKAAVETNATTTETSEVVATAGETAVKTTNVPEIEAVNNETDTVVETNATTTENAEVVPTADEVAV